MPDTTMKTAPFLRSGERNAWSDLAVLIALLPPAVWGTVVFGFRVPVLLLLGTAAAVSVRFLWNLICRRPWAEEAVGAALTGFLTVLCLTSSASYGLALACGAFASAVRILTQKAGFLALHPVALTAVLQKLLFGGWYPLPFTQKLPVSEAAVPMPASVTPSPLEILFSKQIPDIPVLNLLLGNHAGTLGELSEVLILLGMLYLCFKKVIKWKGPVQFLLAAALTAFLFPVTLDNFGSMWAELFSGATVFGAVYLASDHDTVPKTDSARTVYFIGCGVLTVLLRSVISFADGAFLAILLMGLVSRLLDKLLAPRMFGRGKAAKLNFSGDGIDDLLAELPEENEEEFNPRKE